MAPRRSPLTALLLTFCIACGSANAEGCNIANLLFGKVRIEIIPHVDYETGIIFGADFDSKRFAYEKILGRMDAIRMRSGPFNIFDVNGQLCGNLNQDLTIDTSVADCASCSKSKVMLKKVNSNSYAVLSGGDIVGTINGRLPK